MLCPALARQIQRTIRTLTHERQIVTMLQKHWETRTRQLQSRHSCWENSATPLDGKRFGDRFFGDSMQTAQPFSDPAMLRVTL
jgi:hypothetical protein